jgi:ABC-type nitrate/sulfonate/bicarbonate transport system permease component
MMRQLRLAIPIIVFLLGWELISYAGWKDRALFPPPSQCARAFIEWIQTGEIRGDLGWSYTRLACGFLIGVIIAVPLGLLTGRLRRVAETISPLIQMLRPIPPVSVIPLMIVWFGIGEPAKIIAIAFGVFFPVWLNTHLGAQQISPRLLWSASTLTHSRITIFRRVIFPASLPFIVAGMRNGIAIAFVMVFVSELAGASEGIGYHIAVGQLSYRIDRMISGLAVLGASGAMADYLFSKAAMRKYPWMQFLQSR